MEHLTDLALQALRQRQIGAAKLAGSSARPGSDQSQHRMLGEVDHVSLLPNRVRFIQDMAQARQHTTQRQCLVLVTLADARHFNEILRALGHALADDFVRMGAAMIASRIPANVTLYHVSVLSFACLVAIPATISSPAEILRTALVAAQDSRRGTQGWSTYNRRNDEAHQRGFQLLTDLREAIAEDRGLSLAYQPRMTLPDGGVHSAEALLRYPRPNLARRIHPAG